jgi:hypothetical protein
MVRISVRDIGFVDRENAAHYRQGYVDGVQAARAGVMCSNCTTLAMRARAYLQKWGGDKPDKMDAFIKECLLNWGDKEGGK